MDGDVLVRDLAARDVPSVGEVSRATQGVEPVRPAWDSYKAVARATSNGGKMLMLHSDAAPAARTALKTAIVAMTREPECLKVAETVLEGYGISTGERLEATIAAIGRMDAASISW